MQLKIDIEKFIFLYVNEYGPLRQSQKDGLTSLLTYIQEDNNISDLRHAAYMLATVKHECAGIWQPVAENGQGTGKKYGIPDKRTGKTYFGRGFVQLTHYDNYAAMGQVFGLDFLHEPEMVMRPEVSYQIMSYGMRKGSFTGVRLDMFINEKECDYLHARKIINGMDCAEKISSYATFIESALEQCKQNNIKT